MEEKSSTQTKFGNPPAQSLNNRLSSYSMSNLDVNRMIRNKRLCDLKQDVSDLFSLNALNVATGCVCSDLHYKPIACP